MKRDIFWLPEAEKTFNQNVEYLYKKWTIQVINNFLDRVDEVVESISETPYLYPPHENRDDVRKCQVTNQITL